MHIQKRGTERERDRERERERERERQAERERERERERESIVVNKSPCWHFTYLQLIEVQTSSLYKFNWCNSAVYEITGVNV